MALPRILADCITSACRYVDRANSSYEATTLEQNVAGQMDNILNSTKPTAEQMRDIGVAIRDVNDATRALAWVIRVPPAYDPHHNEKAETARGNVRKKLSYLGRLLDGVELRLRSEDLNQGT